MASITINFEKQTARSCGSCSLCCRLLPQKELSKPALTRCQHQRHSDRGSCSIYARRPPSCMMWSCSWLTDAATAALSRPDRSHVVIDQMPDVIGIMDNETGERHDMEAIQVWVDPAYPDAWKHPSLLAYFNSKAAERQIAVLVRYGSSDGFVAFPPNTTGRTEWMVHQSSGEMQETSALEKLQRLAAI
jgi:hypothetical protein